MAAISIHITFGDSKKVIICSIADLVAQLELKFSLAGQDYRLQVWDGDFNDWIDLDDITILEGQPRCKLQILR